MAGVGHHAVAISGIRRGEGTRVHDEEKYALRPAAGAWVALPDMARERDEPTGLAAGARFVVVGGFVGFGDVFDTATWAWGPVTERVVEDGVRHGAGRRRDGDGECGAWRTVAPVPEEAAAAEAVAIGRDGRVAVVGGEQNVYVLSHGVGTAAPSWTSAAAPRRAAPRRGSLPCNWNAGFGLGVRPVRIRPFGADPSIHGINPRARRPFFSISFRGSEEMDDMEVDLAPAMAASGRKRPAGAEKDWRREEEEEKLGKVPKWNLREDEKREDISPEVRELLHQGHIIILRSAATRARNGKWMEELARVAPKAFALKGFCLDLK
ncbi:hypothetical protein HU200_006312 [Digitaria exilis]|uniref:Uncharacterized protein n=1 Tax=Digitaria exilis TaxID=1010633 RepID=A0A835FRD2_9POAL|nr:hypothetical protein HU200_006312 [Digitaria exilis]